MPVWPWLVAPALMLLLIVGFSAACLLLVNRSGKTLPPPDAEEPTVAAEQSAPSSDGPPKQDSAPEEGPVLAVPPALPDDPPGSVAPLFPTRRRQPAPDLELAANTPDKRLTAGASITPLPALSEALLLTHRAEAAPKEVPKATPEREALYDRAVQRFILYDVGRLRGLEGRRAALDFETLGPDAIPALVRGLNRSATLDASCPVMAISDKLAALLARCNDQELLAQVRDAIGKDVGPTPYAAYLTALKQSCAERVKKSQDHLKARVPQLTAALKSNDAAVRRKAANSLGLAGGDAKAAVPALVEALKDDDPQVRGYAARALAAVGPAAVPALLKAARSAPDRPVRILAYLALGESRPIDGESLRALVDALTD
ncbi:MAG TPA: HEAT repeat domain-containing protein, partial [Gemmataceae bacterium]|nr:HEAT repeat domain-containing protein [Gemmataceae bacterium]